MTRPASIPVELAPALPGTEVFTLEHLKGAFAACSSREQLHAVALRSIHISVGATHKLDLQMSRYAMQVCRDLVADLVPCRRADAEVYAAVIFVSSAWPEALACETGALMRLYIANGYVRLNDQTNAFGAESYSSIFPPGRTALEVAIRQDNMDAALVLIEAGELTTTKPKASSRLEPSATDLLALSDVLWNDGHRTATLRAAAMRYQIASTSAAPHSVESVPLPRARRVMGA